MKFKDVKVGQRFTKESWAKGAYHTKIEPIKTKNVKSGWLTSLASDGIYCAYVKPDDEVMVLK